MFRATGVIAVFPKVIQNKLKELGVVINGKDPWDPVVTDERFYHRIMAEKSLGLGESYMDGWWQCRRIDEFISRVLRGAVDDDIKGGVKLALLSLPSKLMNLQSKSRSKIVAEEHYNIGNDLFTSFLDPNLQYSCGYFKNTEELAQAQINKLDLIAEKLELQPGDRLLDIGCGWGGLAKYMAQKYGCHVTGVNIADEQLKFAREYCKGLPVEFAKKDYRDISDRYDKIVSVGMFEHVGQKNYRNFMEVAFHALKDEGIFLLHTIASNQSGPNCDAWLNKYIFPNGVLPSLAQIAAMAEGLFVMEDMQNLGPHYDKTLMHWYANFTNAWPRLASKYGERFRRMFEYYLLCCAGSFRSRTVQLFQVLMTKKGRSQPDVCVR